MIELTLPVSGFMREVAVPLLDDVLRELSGQGSPDERRYLPPPDDPELRETWIENLREDHHSDLAASRRLVQDPSLGTDEPLSIEPEAAESALRGLTAARLRLRELHLVDMTDSSLEEGDFEFEKLNSREQQGYLAYALAAALQENLVLLLGP
jgi:hypothetical protein